jgi:hypothetical protein
MGKSWRRRLVSCFLFFGLSAGLAASPASKDIVVSLERKEIRELDPSGLVLVFFLEIANSSRSSYVLGEYDYRVVVEGSDYFALRTSLEEPIPVERESVTRISLPVRITYADLLERVPVVAGLPKASCYATGLLILTDSRGRQEKIPFAFSGDFPLFQELEVEVKPLEIKTLTIGGAEFTFSFSIRNKNSFDLTLGSLAYRLEAEGKLIAEGVISAGKTIESQAEVTFNLPHMLEFFEVGREVYDTFQKPSAACVLSGDSWADSVWGQLKVGFSKTGDVPISRVQ